jgi:hypothetical protein
MEPAHTYAGFLTGEVNTNGGVSPGAWRQTASYSTLAPSTRCLGRSAGRGILLGRRSPRVESRKLIDERTLFSLHVIHPHIGSFQGR